MMSIFRIIFAALLVTAATSLPVQGTELIEISWPTRHGSPPPNLEGQANQLLPRFRQALTVLPESSIVLATLTQPQIIGLPQKSAETLSPLFLKRYQTITTDPLFREARSHLGYCFASEPPARGLARVYLPDSHSKRTPVILFVHGSGGSFIWYHHRLHEIFPESIVICPAYGTQPSSIPVEYLTECLRRAEEKIAHPLGKPTLVGLSAGGFGACRMLAARPDLFERGVILGAFPPGDAVEKISDGLSIRFLAGAREFFVTDGRLSAAVLRLRSKGAKASLATIPRADHFFLLTHPEESAAILKNAVTAPLKTPP